MSTIRRYIYIDLLINIGFALLAFLALFFFFDLVDELQSVGKPSATGLVYQLPEALTYVGLQVFGHMYELLPIAVLIGGVLVMVRLAQNSEFTILRTSGMGPFMALRTLIGFGLACVAVTMVVGDFAAPWADQKAQLLKARYTGKITTGLTGAWLRERQRYSQFAVNVGAMQADGRMQQIRIYEFDSSSRLASITDAAQGSFLPQAAWELQNVRRTDFQTQNTANTQTLPNLLWPTEISAEMVAVSLLKPEKMSVIALFQYMRHLDANGQTTQIYAIEFWKKLFYPLGCLVMLVLALPFAYLHLRQGGIAGYAFLGVMAGISFFLMNNVFGYIGNLHQWQPWLAAAAPGLIYSGISLGAFSWLVLKR